MVVGYVNENEQVFCDDCWRARAAAGARPSQVLDSEDPTALAPPFGSSTPAPLAPGK